MVGACVGGVHGRWLDMHDIVVHWQGKCVWQGANAWYWGVWQGDMHGRGRGHGRGCVW